VPFTPPTQIRNPLLLLVAGEGFEPSTFGL